MSKSYEIEYWDGSACIKGVWYVDGESATKRIRALEAERDAARKRHCIAVTMPACGERTQQGWREIADREYGAGSELFPEAKP